MKAYTYAALALVTAASTFAACSSEDGATSSSFSGSGATSGAGGAGTTSSGQGGEVISTTGSTGTGGAEECAADESEATLVKKPVDIIFIIDNSGSMGGEIQSVQDNINTNFASIIEASGVDYRVIMVTRHGNIGSEDVCVSAPLSGTDCNPVPADPVENPPIFYHHSFQIASTDAWCRILEAFSAADEKGLHPNGFQDVLRPDAFKTFVVISDDRVSCDNYNDSNTDVAGTAAAAQFDADLLALSPTQFGTAEERNYTYHSIIALEPYDANDLTLPTPPDAPITTKECSPGAQNPGTGHQALSILTGGLRYPTCGLDYTTIFNKIAEGVIDGAKVACDFPLPTPPAGEQLDLETVAVVYTPSDGSPEKVYHQVADPSLCGPGLFYIANGQITLCDETCAEVQADDAAKVKILSGCKSDIPM